MMYTVNMIVIIGLGNPGEKFKRTRHNAGFMAVDFFAVKNGFPDFELSKKYDSLISENSEVFLVKPQTFMNESGRAVGRIIKDHNLEAKDLVVVRDDIDLPLGKIKISKDSGAGGHKGVDSIINALGNNHFIQLKIGICPEKGKPTAVEKFVIKKFTKEEQEILNQTIEKAASAMYLLISEGIEKAMNEYNR